MGQGHGLNVGVRLPCVHVEREGGGAVGLLWTGARQERRTCLFLPVHLCCVPTCGVALCGRRWREVACPNGARATAQQPSLIDIVRSMVDRMNVGCGLLAWSGTVCERATRGFRVWGVCCL